MCKSRQWFCKCCKRIIDKEYFTECHEGKDSCTRKFVLPKFDKKCSTDKFPIAFLIVGNFAHAVTNKIRWFRIQRSAKCFKRTFLF